MKMLISEVAKMSGVSVRTLHYYDEINLLHPAEVNESGYRYYDKEALDTLQQILFYRELEFSLGEIQKIISQADYNKIQALERQRELLTLKAKRLKGLIKLVDDTLRGDNEMSFKEFDQTEIEEAKARWGNTAAYAESVEKTAAYGKKEWDMVQAEGDKIMKKFADIREMTPSSKEAQSLVKEWQDYITKNYYTCSKEILDGLGQMYVGDERFKKNIDRFGEGNALFMADAIKEYCGIR